MTKLKESGKENIIFASCLILMILVLVCSVSALEFYTTSVSNVERGSNMSFIASLKIIDGEKLVGNIKIRLLGTMTKECEIYSNGTFVSSCPGIEIEKIAGAVDSKNVYSPVYAYPNKAKSLTYKITFTLKNAPVKVGKEMIVFNDENSLGHSLMIIFSFTMCKFPSYRKNIVGCPSTFFDS